MVHATRGIGKTFFGLSCAFAVGTGGEFLKFNAPERKPVLYIDGEMSAAVMQERMLQLMLSNGSDVLMDIITPDLQPKDQGSINLSDKRFQDALEPAPLRHPYDDPVREGHVEAVVRGVVLDAPVHALLRDVFELPGA